MKRTELYCCLLLLLACISLPASAKAQEEAMSGDAETARDGGPRVVETPPVLSPPAGGEAKVLRIGGSLTVDAAVQVALENSLDLDLERLNLKQSAAAVGEAEAAAGPKVTLQTSGSALSNPPEGYKISKGAFGYVPTVQSPTPVAFPERDYVLVDDAEWTFFRIAATLSQPLYTWGKLKGAVRLANIECGIAGDKYLTAERTVEKRVRLAYFSALFAEKTESILSQAETIAGQILDDQSKAFEGGIITRQAVVDAAAKKAALSAQLARTVEAGSTARFTLSKLTGIDLEETTLTSGYRRKPPAIEETGLVSAAFQASGMRAELLRRIDQANTLLEIEKASRPFLPDLSLNLSVDVSGQKVPVIGANWTESWDTNVTITLGTRTTLLDSGTSGSKIEQAELSLERARLALNGYELNLELQVRNRVEIAKTAWYEVSQAETELALAEEVRRNASVSFDNELITRAELQSAELARLTAQLAYERALFAYETALIELEMLVCHSLV